MTAQIHRLALAFAAAFALLALLAGYWGLVRRDDLLARADNPRRLLLERRAPRGTIYDRDGAVLAESRGAPGDYTRYYPYPALGPVLGYVSPFYGTAGVEAAADAFLHGEVAGDDDWARAWAELAGRPPVGRAVRLTLDLDLQRLADEALGERTGAIVLLDAAGGQVLALASHPAFDPNTLDENWEVLVTDARAPLLNRATLALYPPGGAFAPALMAAALQADIARPDTAFAARGAAGSETGLETGCRVAITAETLTLTEALRLGCPGPFAELGARLGERRLEQLFADLRLVEAPQIGLPTAASTPDFSDPAALGAGQGSLTVTPFHLALATAALARRGELPAPQLLSAVQAPDGTWQPVAAMDHPVAAFAPETADQVKALLREGHTATAALGTAGQTLAWFTGFAPFTDTRFAVAVVLEDGDSAAAEQIGRALLTAATQAAP